jgi:hypothetical protein
MHHRIPRKRSDSTLQQGDRIPGPATDEKSFSQPPARFAVIGRHGKYSAIGDFGCFQISLVLRSDPGIDDIGKRRGIDPSG